MRNMETAQGIERMESSPEQRMATAKETANRLKSYGGVLGSLGNIAEKQLARVEKIDAFANAANKAYNEGNAKRVDNMYLKGTQLEKMGALKATRERVKALDNTQLKKVMQNKDCGRLERACAKKLLEKPLEQKSVTENPEKNTSLTEKEKSIIRKEQGWSDKIIDSISSMKEYEIYKKAGLKEAAIRGKPALIRPDLDLKQVDEKGRTNEERMKRGLAPLDKDGNSIELHHIGQHADSPLAELTFEEHRCNGNDTILHDKTKETETHGEGNTWDLERQTYWKDRAVYNGRSTDL